MMSINIITSFNRGKAMNMVSAEAKKLLVEHKNTLEVSKNEIISDLKEFGYEIARIKVLEVQIWDNGEVNISFGPLVSDDIFSV